MHHPLLEAKSRIPPNWYASHGPHFTQLFPFVQKRAHQADLVIMACFATNWKEHEPVLEKVGTWNSGGEVVVDASQPKECDNLQKEEINAFGESILKDDNIPDTQHTQNTEAERLEAHCQKRRRIDTSHEPTGSSIGRISEVSSSGVASFLETH